MMMVETCASADTCGERVDGIRRKQGVATSMWRLSVYLDVAFKAASVAAVVVAGTWAWHLHVMTGEAELNPELAVSAEVLPYGKETRLIVLHVHERNVGKVPVELGPDALTITAKRVPEGAALGFIDLDSQPVVFEKKDLFKKYNEGIWLSPGADFQDAVPFVVAPGTYYVEGDLALSDGDFVNDILIQRVE